MNYNDDIGSIIISARKKKNISQNELAKKLYVTRQAVSNWENNKTRPDISVLFNLCKVLDIDIKKVIEMNNDITVEDVIEVEKKKTTRHNIIFFSIILFLVIGIIFTLVIVFNRNEFALYNVYLDSDEFELNNSIIIKSKVQNYFQLGTLVSKLDITNNDTEYNIRLYKKSNDKERLVFAGKYVEDFNITEKYGYGEYFSVDDTSLDNLYLEISFDIDGKEYIYNYKLRVEENFKNNSLIYLKNNAISEEVPKDGYVKIDKSLLLNNGYTYDISEECFIKEINDFYVKFYPQSMFITLKEKVNGETVLIDYFVNQDRFKVSVYDTNLENKTVENFNSKNILKNYEYEVNFLQNELELFGGN